MVFRKITILIVDDHEVVRQGLHAYLDARPDFRVVAEASSGEQAVELALEYLPDVVLMDLVMDGMGGVRATRKIKDATPRTQVIALTSYHQDELIFPVLQAGAVSYVLKDIAMEELAIAIQKAAQGEAVLHPIVAKRVIQEVNGAKRTFYNPYKELTNREMEILQLIARGNTNNHIAEILVISENTVKGHVSNILSKLQLADRTQAAVYAWKKGLVHRDSQN